MKSIKKREKEKNNRDKPVKKRLGSKSRTIVVNSINYCWNIQSGCIMVSDLSFKGEKLEIRLRRERNSYYEYIICSHVKITPKHVNMVIKSAITFGWNPLGEDKIRNFQEIDVMLDLELRTDFIEKETNKQLAINEKNKVIFLYNKMVYSKFVIPLSEYLLNFEHKGWSRDYYLKQQEKEKVENTQLLKTIIQKKDAFFFYINSLFGIRFSSIWLETSLQNFQKSLQAYQGLSMFSFLEYFFKQSSKLIVIIPLEKFDSKDLLEALDNPDKFVTTKNFNLQNEKEDYFFCCFDNYEKINDKEAYVDLKLNEVINDIEKDLLVKKVKINLNDSII